LEEIFGLIERYEPILQKLHKITRYRMVDPFLTFWFRYVFPFQSHLELGRTKTVLDYVRKDLGVIAGRVCEAIIRERIALSDVGFKLPFEPDAIGSWWTRKQEEIDIVAVNKKERTAFLAECKLSAAKVDRGVIHDLVRRSNLFNGIFPTSNRYLAIFTIGHVSKEISAEAQEAGIEIKEL
jgi:AAA+ ATPase superfamily predicted ATPase